MTTAAAFWLRLEAEEKARKAQIAAVRIRATGNHLVAAQDEPEPLTCWGLSSFCAEVGHKCRAAGKCVYTPPESPSMRAIREAGQADAQAVMRSPRTILRARSMNQTEQEK